MTLRTMILRTMTLRMSQLAKAAFICMAIGAGAVGLVRLASESAVAQSTQRISSIEVQGQQRIETETILSYLQLAPGDEVNPSVVNDALKRLFATGLFRDVRITPRGGGVLLVEVAENPVISEISFEGNREIEDDLLLAQIRSRPRGAFTRARAEADAQTILDIYRASGRFSATVEPKIIEREGNRVDLVFEIAEGDAVGISSINFVGNTEYSDRRLRTVIETSESAWWKILATSDNYNPDRLELDKELLRRFYFARGYADFEVISAVAELSPERDGFFITFTVSEGEQYDVGEVEVYTEIPGFDVEAYRGLVETDTGDTYDADLVQRTVSQIQAEMGAEGVRFVEVRPEARKRRAEDGAPVVDIRYNFLDAPRVYVERIEIEGNSRTLDEVIRREFEFVEGDAFSAYALQRSRSNVQSLGFFSKTEVETEPGSAEDRVVVRTTVEERSTGDLSFGVGFSSVESFGGTVSLTERNFLGRGQLVRIAVSATSSRQTYDFAFVEPYFLGRDLEAGVNVYHVEIDQVDESDYETRRTGFAPSIGFRVDENSRIRFRYRIEAEDIQQTPNDASPLVQADEGDRVISSLGFDYTLDFRNDRNEPTEGFILELKPTFAGIGGDALYLRGEGSIKGYTSFFREDVIVSLELAGGAIVGFDDDDVKISDRFTLGGDSFRGFDASGVGPRDTNDATFGLDTFSYDAALGGNYYAIARADVSFPIGLPEEYGVYGGVFADAGSVWGLDDTSYEDDLGTLTVDDSFALRATTGVSLFWSSPLGPLRFNFAWPLLKEDEDKDEFFSFGGATRF